MLPAQIITQRSSPLIGPELKDIFFQCIDLLAQIQVLLDVSAVEIAHETAVKNRFHWTNGGKEILDRFEMLAAEHPGVHGRFIAVGFVNVPASENQIIQGGERDKVHDFRRTVFVTFSQADRSQLSQ